MIVIAQNAARYSPSSTIFSLHSPLSPHSALSPVVSNEVMGRICWFSPKFLYAFLNLERASSRFEVASACQIIRVDRSAFRIAWFDWRCFREVLTKDALSSIALWCPLRVSVKSLVASFSRARLVPLPNPKLRTSPAGARDGREPRREFRALYVGISSCKGRLWVFSTACDEGLG